MQNSFSSDNSYFERRVIAVSLTMVLSLWVEVHCHHLYESLISQVRPELMASLFTGPPGFVAYIKFPGVCEPDCLLCVSLETRV